VKTPLILDEAPYVHERSYNGLRLATAVACRTAGRWAACAGRSLPASPFRADAVAGSPRRDLGTA